MKIDFPDDEIPKLSKQSVIITHRVSDDFKKFKIGDIVYTAWGKKFKVTGLKQIDDIEKSPFKKELTVQQHDFLRKFSQIAVIKLEKV